MEVVLPTVHVLLLIGLSLAVNLSPAEESVQGILPLHKSDTSPRLKLQKGVVPPQNLQFKQQHQQQQQQQPQLQQQLDQQNQQQEVFKQVQQQQQNHQHEQQQQQQQQNHQREQYEQMYQQQLAAVKAKQNGIPNKPADSGGRANQAGHFEQVNEVNPAGSRDKVTIKKPDSLSNNGNRGDGGFPKQFQKAQEGKGNFLNVNDLQNAAYKVASSKQTDQVKPLGQQNAAESVKRGDIPSDRDSNVIPVIPVLPGGGYKGEANVPGVIRTVDDPVNQNQNNVPQNNFQNFVNFPRNSPREVGGMRLSWDWSDFSVTFDDYGPAELKVRRAPHATTGEPWPLPQYFVRKRTKVYKIDKDAFHFKVVAETCDVVEEAIRRYRKHVLENAVEDMYDNLQNAEGTNIDNPASKYEQDLYQKAPVITYVEVKILKPCSKYPTEHSDESYDIKIKKSGASIMAKEVWGALRGLETFSQLVWKGLDGEDPDDRGKNANLFVMETVVSDYPRFPHRGLLIDSSRHFIFKEVIFDIMDAMEQNKMNVLHWHIVDDQSFPYESEVFPELSKKGAFHPSFVYTQEDLREIIEFARLRGIRIIPEFDTPGHTYSWGLSRPELLTQCYQGSQIIKGYLGPIDPTKNSTYRFLKTLFSEIMGVFKDQYLHLGGDEVPLACWSSNPDVVNFGLNLQRKKENTYEVRTEDQNFYNTAQFDIRKVYEYYVKRLINDLKDISKTKKEGMKIIMWQEVTNNDLELPKETVIEVWMGEMADVSRVIGMGYKVVYATCWYLDRIEYGTKWTKYYQCDPVDETFGYSIDEKMVLGGEACLWSEYVDNENMMTTLWPRASATAERLWSAKHIRDLDAAGARLQEHRCRMLSRGLSVAQISGPDYCLRRGFGRRGDQKEHNNTCTSGRCVKSRDNSFVDAEDNRLHLKRGGYSKNCQRSDVGTLNIVLLGMLAVILFAIVIGYQKSGGRLPAYKLCKNRTIMILFTSILFIYLMSYATFWMNGFEVSRSIRRTNAADVKR